MEIRLVQALYRVAERRSRSGHPRSVQLTGRDLEVLSFIAEHRLVLPAHVGALLGVSAATANGRLRALTRAGLLKAEVLFHRQPACYQITRSGLGMIGSSLPPPRLDRRCHGHDAGLAWLWLAARGGSFGEVAEVISERALRSSDGSPERKGEPLGVRLGGYGPGGRPRLHYPDLVLLTGTGHRVAVELELSAKGRTRRETILAGYATDARIDAVLYLVEKPRLAQDIRGAAAKLGISQLVHVQPVHLGAPARDTHGRHATRARTAEKTIAAGAAGRFEAGR